jgi:uncharacterized protein
MYAIAAAALAGLMATPHCAGMCGGFATACARPRGGLWAWHGGRLSTYAVLGALAGTLGAALPGPAWLPAVVSSALLVWFAGALAGVLPQPALPLPGLRRAGQALVRRPGTGARFLFGVVTGLLPCGMVYAALGLAVAAANPLTSAAAMVAFGAATVPGLTVLSLGVQRLVLRSIWGRRAMAGLILAVGLWSVGARTTGTHAHAHGADPAVQAGHQAPAAPGQPHAH